MHLETAEKHVLMLLPVTSTIPEAALFRYLSENSKLGKLLETLCQPKGAIRYMCLNCPSSVSHAVAWPNHSRYTQLLSISVSFNLSGALILAEKMLVVQMYNTLTDNDV